MKKLLLALWTLALVITITSCELGSGSYFIPKPTGSFEVVFKYRNMNGTTPELVIDLEKTSEEISYTGYGAISNGSEIVLSMSNISIADDVANYSVASSDDVYFQYFEDGEWVTDVEFTTAITKQNNIAVVLVLDKSQSINDTDFMKIKDYAKNFLDIVYNNNSDAHVGLVTFASYSDITSLGVRNLDDSYALHNWYSESHMSHLKNEIDNMTKGQYTALYSAVDKAHSLINLSAYDGCAIVSFTDGVNNNSLNISQSTLVEKLEASDKLKSFTIGFGRVNDEELESIAVNGAYRKATNTTELKKIFESFSNAVSTFHDLEVRMAAGIVEEWRELKVTLDAK